MYEERESDVPEWEEKEEEIPESLKQKWRQEEIKGIHAGVCGACGYPYTSADLSCRHCGKTTDISDGVFASLKRWFFKTWIGLLLLTLILLGIFLFLVR